jgi:hypothetical protein
VSDDKHDSKDTEASHDAGHGADGHEPEGPFEKDNPRMTVITVAYVAIALVVIVAVIGTREFFNGLVRSEKQAKVGDPVSSLLTDLRKTEQAHLTSYQWVDKDKGLVRMPSDKARDLVLAKYRATPVETPPAPAPAPPAPVASAGSASADGAPSDVVPPVASGSADPSQATPAGAASSAPDAAATDAPKKKKPKKSDP